MRTAGLAVGTRMRVALPVPARESPAKNVFEREMNTTTHMLLLGLKKVYFADLQNRGSTEGK